MNQRTRRHCYRCGHVSVPRVLPAPSLCPMQEPVPLVPKSPRPTYGGGLGITEVIGSNRRKVRELSRRHGGTNVRVFGSVARREASAESDIDIVIDRIPGRRFRRVDLSLALTRLLRRRVDIVAEDQIYWLIQPSVVTEAVPL